MNTQTSPNFVRIIFFVFIVIFCFPTGNVRGAWYKPVSKQEKITKADYKVSKTKSLALPKNKISKKRLFWRIMVGFGLSLFLGLFASFQVIFIIPMYITFLGIIALYVKKDKLRKEFSPKPAYVKLKNQRTWTLVLGIIATVFSTILVFPHLVWLSVIPLVIALVSLAESSQSVKKGKSGKSCLGLSITLSICFILMAGGLLYLILYAFS